MELIKVIKRDGREVDFDKKRIFTAIAKAFQEVYPKISKVDIKRKSELVGAKVLESIEENYCDSIAVESIQDIVECELMDTDKTVAKEYITYRYKKTLVRESNTTDKSILELIDGANDYWNDENSNKDAKIVTTQRDYLAGVTSTDIAKRFLLPKDVVEAHENGIIHFHDADYFAQHIHNCELINLQDMLQNGTVVNKIMIEKPHRLITATTIATQIITAVASSQYGGSTITLTALAPFVRDSYYYHLKKYQNRGLSDLDSVKFAKEDTYKEIVDSVQTFNYQINSMSTTNGQTPFLTVFMYLNETKEYKKELSALIEEFLKQRIKGLKNETGVYITPAFPKLIYVLEEDNINNNTPYFYLTKLAAECTAKRMVPDYISEKKMLEYKIDRNGNGNCFPCMGCVDGKEIVTYKFNSHLFVESFERMWNRLSDYFEINEQVEGNSKNLYLGVRDVQIYDTKNGFVNVKKVIRNTSDQWINVKIQHGRNLLCTTDHPFHTERGRIRADKLIIGDNICINPFQYCEETLIFDTDKAWLLGFILCDGSYTSSISSSIAFKGEDDIQEKYISAMKKCFNVDVKIVERHRGNKGNYKDLISIGKSDGISNYLNNKFEGRNKINRHIPNEVFSWNYNAKLAFLAGMIDADGYINPTTHNGSVVQIGSTNKELALQQMALAQSLGMPAVMYQNHYNKNKPQSIRYRVEFYPCEELLTFIVSQKKLNNFVTGDKSNTFFRAKINSVEKIENYTTYSYDVETESDFFEVSGIYSHNCRSFLTPYVDENGNSKYYGRLTIR